MQHPCPRDAINTVYLKAAHILRRAIADFDPDHESLSVRRAVLWTRISANEIPVQVCCCDIRYSCELRLSSRGRT